MAAAEQVQVQVKNRLAGAGAVVEDGAVAGEQVALCGKFCGDELELSEERLVIMVRVVQRSEVFPWTNENVSGRLGANVLEGEDIVVFVDDF